MKCTNARVVTMCGCDMYVSKPCYISMWYSINELFPCIKSSFNTTMYKYGYIYLKPLQTLMFCRAKEFTKSLIRRLLALTESLVATPNDKENSISIYVIW